MQVFRFLNMQYGLQALRERRLKVSDIGTLNDPFEFLAPNLSERETRRVFTRHKKEFSRNKGILCFSQDWKNPVLWSHYAESHQGLCLGFSFKAELVPVHYSKTRIQINVRSLLADPDREQLILKCLSTKFLHWQYEQEVRAFVELSDMDKKTGLYFFDFCESMTLTHVIVGCKARVTRAHVQEALDIRDEGVHIVKARPAFQTFKIVENRDTKAWR
jgi:hypothetical protein